MCTNHPSHTLHTTRPVGSHPVPWRRHQWVRLSAAGWEGVLSREWADVARDCLTHWAGRGLPLIVTRQPAAPIAPDVPLMGPLIALGLPAPLRWDRLKLAVQVWASEIVAIEWGPTLIDVLHHGPADGRPTLRGLHDQLQSLNAPTHVHGSYAWQTVCGWPCVRAGSDMDLGVHVASLAAADTVAELLWHADQRCPPGLRLDGELIFPDGSAVAWREWAPWRQGRVGSVLVKRLRCVELVAQPALIWRQAGSDLALAAS